MGAATLVFSFFVFLLCSMVLTGYTNVCCWQRWTWDGGEPCCCYSAFLFPFCQNSDKQTNLKIATYIQKIECETWLLHLGFLFMFCVIHKCFLVSVSVISNQKFILHWTDYVCQMLFSCITLVCSTIVCEATSVTEVMLGQRISQNAATMEQVISAGQP